MNMNDVSVITLDGPSGSSKSTIAYQVSLKLGYNYLDSGAIYRTIALQFYEKTITDVGDIDLVSQYV